MSFLARLQSSRNNLLYLVTGSELGESCWYYVLVDKAKLELFKARLQADSIPLKEYGTILYSGWGDAPPGEITLKIEEQYA